MEGKKIKADRVEEILPLTPFQEGILFHYIENQQPGMYLEQLSLNLNGNIKLDSLKQSLDDIVKQNEMLRCIFRFEKLKKPIQVILKGDESFKAPVYEYNCEESCDADKEEKIIQFKKEEREKGIDITTEPYHFSLMKWSDECLTIILSAHHIILDGWSSGILLKEIMERYFSITKGCEWKPKKKAKYKDYIRWIQSQQSEESFWQNYLDSYQNTSLALTSEKEETEFSQASFILDEKLVSDLEVYSKEHYVTKVSVLYTAWALLMRYYRSSDDIMFGITTSGRTPEVEWLMNSVGLFINTLPLRIRIGEDDKTDELIQKVHVTLSELEKHQTDSIHTIKEYGNISSGEELFDSIVVVENYPLEHYLLSNDRQEEIKISDIDIYECSNYDLALKVRMLKKTELVFLYNEKCVCKKTVTDMATHLCNILEGLMKEHTVKSIKVMTTMEEKCYLEESLNTYKENANVESRALPEIFREILLTCVDKIAVRDISGTYTYGEIEQRSNFLANKLLELGIMRNEIVGIMVERNVYMVIGILGILKAGGAYLPLNDEFPEERIEFMLKDCNVKIVTGRGSDLSRFFSNFEGTKIDLEEELQEGNSLDPCLDLKSEDLAYVMYTSGSTGKPKGVLIEHRSIPRLGVRANYVTINKEDKILMTGAVTFDAATFEIWTAMLNGIELHLVDKGVILDPFLLSEYIEQNHITVMFMSTSLFHQHIVQKNDMFKTLRYLVIGGDVLKHKYASILKKACSNVILTNGYGPTEGTTFSLSYAVPDEVPKHIPIGTAITGTYFYICNHLNKLLPTGVTGELLIGGLGVGKGYLNNENLTKQKFIESSFIPGDVLYKTGDLVRENKDGQIEFIGRKDHQVKIHGFRVEADEIAIQLLQYKKIKDAAVIVQSHENGGKYLIAYVVLIDEEAVTVTEIKSYLKGNLPSYMIPSYFVLLDKLPLNINGKIDVAQLPKPQIVIEDGSSYTEPKTAIEKLLADIWCEVLELKQVYVEQNYYDLGGDSIKAIQICSKLRKYGKKLDIKNLLNYPTIGELQDYVEDVENTGTTEPTGEMALTPIQRWFFTTTDEQRNHFNQSFILKQETRYQIDVVEKTLEELVKNHDVLRSSFIGEKQIIPPYKSKNQSSWFTLQEFDFSDEKEPNERIRKETSNMQRTLDITNGLLMKVGVFHTSLQDYLIVIVHHLVMDAVSWGIFIEDFNSVYECLVNNKSVTLSEKTDSFKTWSNYLLDYANSEKLEKERSYWSQILTGLQKYTEDSIGIYEDSGIEMLRLDKKVTSDLLTNVNQAFHTEIRDVLLTSLGITAEKWNQRKKISVYLEGHGRDCMDWGLDLSRTIGWFTCAYPVVLDFTNSDDIRNKIIWTKDMLRRVPNKGIGFGLLMYEAKNRLEEQKCAYDYSFNYFGKMNKDSQFQMFEGEDDLAGIPVSVKSKRMAFIELNAMIIDEQLVIVMNYNKKEVSKERANEFLNIYAANVAQVVEYAKGKEHSELTCSDCTDPDLNMENLLFLKEKIEDEVEDIYGLSPMQEGILFHSLMTPDKEIYHNQICIPLTGKIDRQRMEESLTCLISKHAILRNCFISDINGIYKQVVLANRTVKMDYYVLDDLREEEQEEKLEEILKEKRESLIDLAKTPLFGLSLFKIREDQYKLIIQFHHIILDGWSMNLVLNDLFHIYQSKSKKKQIKMDKIYPYSNFIQWLNTKEKEKALNYWNEYLCDYETKAIIPRYTKNRSGSEGNYKKYDLVIDKEMTQYIGDIASKNKVTRGSLFEAAWGIILQKLNQTEDVIFGVVSSGRPEELTGADVTVGLFITTLPLRVKKQDGMTILNLIQNVQTEHMNSQQFSYISLNDIQSQSNLKGELIDHLFVYENYPIKDTVQNGEGCDFVLNREEIKAYERTNYEFNVTVLPGEETVVEITYNSNLYADYLIQQIGTSYHLILEQILADINMPVSEIELVGPKDKKFWMNEFNDTFVEDKYQNVVEWFEDTVEKNSNRIAVLDGERSLTYKELNQMANVIAYKVLERKEKGVDNFFGVLCTRSIEAVAVILGILKAGATYIPFDTQWPSDRIEYILEVTNCKMVFVNSTDVSCPEGIAVYNLNELSLEHACNENPGVILSGDSLAYSIFTSGSTGKPKGVLIQHKNLLSYASFACRHYTFSKEDSVALFTSLAFDLTVTSLFCLLLTGGSVVIYQADQYNEAGLIYQVIEEGKTNILKLTPAHLNLLAEKKFSKFTIEKIIVGGDILYQKDCVSLIENYGVVKIYNEYGPTETTVGCVVHEYDKDKDLEADVPIGIPADNVKVCILDKDGKLLPKGIAGELMIAGSGVGAGYYQNSALTEKSFVPSIFDKNEKMYHSGDKVYLSDKNEIVYLNRLDQQVKIHGYRIELKEIEYKISTCTGVKSAAVIIRSDSNNDKYICAFVSAEEGITKELINEKLLEKLPGYMIPKKYIFLDNLPLTVNKKVDVQLLKTMTLEEQSIGKKIEKPVNEIEERLVELWSSILKIEQVSVDDNFFELGGDSIKAIQLMARLNNMGYTMDMKDLFHYPTIKQICPYIREDKSEDEQGMIKGEVSLTPIQQYFFQSVLTDQHHYNQSVMIFSNEDLNENLVSKTFDVLLCLHDALRMIYQTQPDHSVVQKNRGLEGKLYDIYNYFVTKEQEESFITSKVKEIQSSIQLQQGPLVKIGLFHSEEGTHMLIVIHHLVVDGVSWRILLEDFEKVYLKMQQGNEIEIPRKTTSFKTWSEKLMKYAKEDVSSEIIDYWRQVSCAKGSPIPKDRAIDGILNSDTRVLHEWMSVEKTEQLIKDSNYAYKTETNDILMCALGQALYEWTGETQFKIAMEGHGREEIIPDVNLSRTVGWFTSVYPVLLDMQAVDGDPYGVKTIKYMLRKIPNKGIDYGIIKYLRNESGYEEESIPEISFNYLGKLDEINRNLFAKSKYEPQDNRSIQVDRRYLLDFSAVVIDGKMEIRLEYSPSIHDESTVESLLKLVHSKIEMLIEHCCKKQDVELTPYDYGNDEISMQELDYLSNLFQ